MSTSGADWLIFVGAFAATLALTSIVRQVAIRRHLFDVPNERSSHRLPTPRAGGLAFVIVFMAGLQVLALRGQIGSNAMIALFGAGTLVACVGFLDDLWNVSFHWRLVAHVLAALWIVQALGGSPTVPFLGVPVALGWSGTILIVLYLVWLTNLYNFMDGIDGIAGIQAVTVCAAGAVVACVSDPSGTGWAVPLLLCSVVSGFLVWNFPNAKIFMGDVGSGFLGVMLGGLSLVAAQAIPPSFWSWIILIGVFVVDSTTTLFRRVYRGEKFYLPHRSHAYQFASRRIKSHVPVTVTVGLINLFWLLPIALAVVAGLLDGVLGVFIAYAPLVWLAYRFKAGARELQSL